MSGAGRAQPSFYYDFASPDAYLAAERVMHVLPEVPEWIPVRLDGLAAGGVGAFRCAEEELIYREDVEERARRYELQPIRWPDPFPADTAWAMLAATYAKQIGRGARGVKANREYELIVRKAGRGPALLRGPGQTDHVEVLEIATGEIALFWDTEPATTGRLARALRADLAQLESAEFLAKWRRWQTFD